MNKLKTKDDPHYDDYSFLVYGIVKTLVPERVVEVGLGPLAYSAKAIISALIENEEMYGMFGKDDNLYSGRYYAIEINPSEEALAKLNQFDEKYWEVRIVTDELKDNKDNIWKFTKFKDINDENERPVNLFLVDGNHNLNHVISDVQNMLGTNSFDIQNGLIVFHDATCFTVRLAINRLADQFKLDVIYLNQLGGIALARVSNRTK